MFIDCKAAATGPQAARDVVSLTVVTSVAISILDISAAPAQAQTAVAATSTAKLIVRADGPDRPTDIEGPNGVPLDDKRHYHEASIPLPTSGLSYYDLVVNYPFGSLPLRVRLHPQSSDMQITVAVDRPKSCADVYLKPLEKPTLSPKASIRAAFTLGYLIDGRAGANSCDFWPFRAARARFDRYYNAMERSGFMVIPEGVKEALRSSAASAGDRHAADQLIARSNKAEKQRLAISLQSDVLTAVAQGDFSAAHATSEVLLDVAEKPELTEAVTGQISLDAIEKQTRDLAERAGVEQNDRPE